MHLHVELHWESNGFNVALLPANQTWTTDGILGRFADNEELLFNSACMLQTNTINPQHTGPLYHCFLWSSASWSNTTESHGVSLRRTLWTSWKSWHCVWLDGSWWTTWKPNCSRTFHWPDPPDRSSRSGEELSGRVRCGSTGCFF